MSGMVPKRQQDGTWVNTPIGEVLTTVGLEDIGGCISGFQNTVAQYIATHHIMEFSLTADQKPGLRLSRIWWEQPTLDILGIMVGHAAAEGRGGDRDVIIGGGGEGEGE